jgi:thiosulfate/3-mercaptopyruvate sulfurtransferase
MLNKDKLAAIIVTIAFSLFFTLKSYAAEPLVSVDWLKNNLSNEKLIVLDIRNKIDGGSKDAFEASHIPTAVYSNYLEDGWRTTVDGIVGKLPPLKNLEVLVGGLGIGNDSHVIVVPGGVSSTDFGSAARVYWTFKVLGHNEVSILDGGYAAWLGKLPTQIETGSVNPKAEIFKADFQPKHLATTEDVVNALANNESILVDARPLEQFLGKSKSGKALAAGTIPGSFNLQQQTLIEGDTTFFLDSATLAQLVKEAGIESKEGEIVFCNTGHWATVPWFALSEILGHENVKNYDGSMVEWTADPARPLENNT